MFLPRVKFPDPLFFKMPPRREKKQGSTMGEVSDSFLLEIIIHKPTGRYPRVHDQHAQEAAWNRVQVQGAQGCQGDQEVC